MKKNTKKTTPPIDDPNDTRSDFEKYGFSVTEFDIEFEITQEDMEKDLVKRTEGKVIKAKDLDGEQRN